MRIEQDVLLVKSGIIVHAVSVNGKLEGGFTKQLIRNYPQIVEPYMQLCRKVEENPIDRLGQVLLVPISNQLVIANLFCLRDSTVERQFDHMSFIICLNRLMESDKSQSLIYFPYKMGAGILGNEWKLMEQYVEKITGTRARICIFEGKPRRQ